MKKKDKGKHKDWFGRDIKKAVNSREDEADYDELAAVYRAGGIPINWDIFRAEILNEYLADTSFDFQAYAAGFEQACIRFRKNIVFIKKSS